MSAKESAAIILSAADPAEAMGQLMTACRGAYIAAKTAKNQTIQKAEARKWRRVTDAIGYHFSVGKRVARWGSFATGQGPYSLVAEDEFKAAAKAAREHQDEADKIALAEFAETQRTKQAEAWRAMSSDAQAEALFALVQNSHDDTFGRLVALIDDAAKAAEAAKAADAEKAAAKAAKAAARKAAKAAKAAA
jgi:hypothetical protein